MKRISPKSRKVKLPSGKRPQLSQEHQQRIQKFRQSNTVSSRSQSRRPPIAAASPAFCCG